MYIIKAMREQMFSRTLSDLFSDTGLVYEDIEVLTHQNQFVGVSDYVDNIQISDVKMGVMRSTDHFERPYIVLRLKAENGEETIEGILVVFQRYSFCLFDPFDYSQYITHRETSDLYTSLKVADEVSETSLFKQPYVLDWDLSELSDLDFRREKIYSSDLLGYDSDISERSVESNSSLNNDDLFEYFESEYCFAGFMARDLGMELTSMTKQIVSELISGNQQRIGKYNVYLK